MPLKSQAVLPARSPLQVCLVLVAGLLVVFVVPFYVPVTPAVSDAYVFGFNNRAALILFALFALGFAWWSGGLGLTAPQPRESAGKAVPPMSRRLLTGSLLVTLAATLAAWLAYRRIGAINEGTYLMDRLEHLAAGEKMYRDFEFLYGPLILEIPLALHRVGLSLIDAYYLAWAAEWVLGVFLLWLTVQWAAQASPRRNGIFLLAFLGFIFSVISLGPNYTPLRFVSSPFFAVACWRVWRNPGRVPLFAGVALSLAGSAWTLSLSPEQGLAYCAGTLAFFLLFELRLRPGAGVALAMLVVGEAVLVGLLLRSGVVPFMRGMAQGGYNLPLLPSLVTLVLLLLLVVAVCVLLNGLRLHRRGGPLEYLVLVSLAALPAAFGRCDGGHLFMNTLGAYLVAWTALSRFPSAGRWMVWSYVPSALFLPLALYQANNVVMYPVKAALFAPANPVPQVRRETQWMLRRSLGPARSEALLRKWKAAYHVVLPSDVPRSTPLLAPFGYPSSLLLAGLPPITNGRYRGLGNVMVPAEVQDKIAEMRRQPATLLLVGDNQCPAGEGETEPPSANATAAADRVKRHELFLNLLPLFLPRVRHREDLLAPVCQYVRSHYHGTAYTAPFADTRILEASGPN